SEDPGGDTNVSCLQYRVCRLDSKPADVLGNAGVALPRKGERHPHTAGIQRVRSTLARARARLAQKSDAARCDVAINVVPSAEEDDPVTCRIGLIIFQLVVRN